MGSSYVTPLPAAVSKKLLASLCEDLPCRARPRDASLRHLPVKREQPQRCQSRSGPCELLQASAVVRQQWAPRFCLGRSFTRLGSILRRRPCRGVRRSPGDLQPPGLQLRPPVRLAQPWASLACPGLQLSFLQNRSVDSVDLRVPSGSHRLLVRGSSLWSVTQTCRPWRARGHATGASPQAPESLLVCCSSPAGPKVGPWTTASASPGNWSEIPVLGPHPRASDLETPGVQPSTLCFNKPSGDSDARAGPRTSASVPTLSFREGRLPDPKLLWVLFKEPLRVEEVPVCWRHVTAVTVAQTEKLESIEPSRGWRPLRKC